MRELTREEILELLTQYGISTCEEYEMIDSSHGEKDIRHNYIIDKKYVLRINSMKVMTEERLKELNTLIKRYNDFGLKAPYYLSRENGTYLTEYQDCYCYLSEYLDYPVAYDVQAICCNELLDERIDFICKFAEKFKDYDLIETLSMYSIFELAPYDQPKGIDEKQENFNDLIHDLNTIGEFQLADKLMVSYTRDRNELLSFYKELPRCVFQGDENFSNLCVDENNHILGLFDFNMSGTEVIVNYLANIAFQGKFHYSEEILDENSAKEVFDMIMESYRESTERIKMHYHFSEQEVRAYELYSRIVMISGYMNQGAFSKYMKNEKYKEKIVELLRLIAEVLSEKVER